MTLDRVPIGGEGIVSAVMGDPCKCQRLGEMGLIVGTPVRVVRTAPMGDPLELRVRGYNVSLRKSEAALITISS